jgi:hypothetical protein
MVWSVFGEIGPIVAHLVERVWWFARRQVSRPYGWVLPLALAPVAFISVLAGVGSDIGAVVGVLVAAIVICLFWQIYVNLWRGDVPWMKGPRAIPRAALWSASMWLLTIAVLAPISSLFYNAGWIGVRSGIGGDPEDVLQNSLEFTNLYLWQTADAIPGLGVTETMSLSRPIEYDDWKLGLLLLLYKAAVLIPLIAAFRGVWKSRGDAGTAVGVEPARVGAEPKRSRSLQSK